MSLPAMRARPHAETMGYTGALAELWKEHSKTVGGVNPLVEDRASLKREGLPVVQLRQDRVRSRRGDVSARNARAHAGAREQAGLGPSAAPCQQPGPGSAVSSPQSEPRALDCRSEWHKTLDAEREGRESQQDLPAQPDPVVIFPPFYSGCSKWPVSAQNLVEVNRGRETGLATRGEELRWSRRGCLVCAGDGEVVPHAKQFVLRYSCVEMHPGLCCETDAAVYEDVQRRVLKPLQ